MDRHTVKEDGKYIQGYATFRTIRSEGGSDGAVWTRRAVTA